MKWLHELSSEIGKILLEAARRLVSISVLAFIIALVLGVMGLAVGGWSIHRADRYQRLVEAAIGKSTENTPQTMKALESLILAYVETDDEGAEIKYQELIASATLSGDFAGVLGEMHAALSKGSLAAPAGQLQLARADASAHDAVITEHFTGEDRGFLFLPVRLLYPTAAQFNDIREERAAKVLGIKSSSTDPPVEQCVESYLERICNDILTTRLLVAPLVKSVAEKSIVADGPVPHLTTHPVQAYVITGNGLNRIVSQEGSNSSRYMRQFNASLSFPTRPYYLGAMKEADGFGKLGPLTAGLDDGIKLGKYFYVSEPYLDIGGNGIVVTLARAFRYGRDGDSDSHGVVAFDLEIASYSTIRERLERMVRELGGTSAVAECSNGTPDPPCSLKSGDAALYDAEQIHVKKLVKAATRNDSASDIAGNITLLSIVSPAETTPQLAGVTDAFFSRMLDIAGGLIAHPSREIRFTMPVQRELGDNADRITLLVASLNVGRYLQNTAISGAIALSLLGIAVTIVISTLVTEARLQDTRAENKKALDEQAEQERKKLDEAARQEREDLRTALDNVDTVMQSAQVPYVRLDNDDFVIDGNGALADFLGFPPTKDSVHTRLLHTRFEGWLADEESRREYQRVQRSRRAGVPVKPYRLTFRRDDGTTRVAEVVSSVVPATQLSSLGLPETFGILVSPPLSPPGA